MTQENVELARRAILGWNDRGVEALVEALDPEVEFHAPKESMNPGVYRGPDGVRDYFGRLAEVVDESRIDSVEVIDVDDTRVIAVVRSVGKDSALRAGDRGQLGVADHGERRQGGPDRDVHRPCPSAYGCWPAAIAIRG